MKARAATLRIAQDLHLKGSVRNKSDGSVEMIAQGERTTLEELISKLRAIFTNNQIQEIDIHFVKPEKIYSDFSVI